MKKQNMIIGGVVILFLVVGLLYWWFTHTIPSDSQVDGATKNIKQVDVNILDMKTTREIENRKIMGNIPIEVNDNYDHINLFQ